MIDFIFSNQMTFDVIKKSAGFKYLFMTQNFPFLYLFTTESNSDLVEGAYANTNARLIYGVFTTGSNAIAGSAICAFSLQVHK
jgi:Sema domain